MSLIALALLSFHPLSCMPYGILLLKQSSNKYIAGGWQIIISAVVALVDTFLHRPFRARCLSVGGAQCISTLIHFGLLMFAYNDHDFLWSTRWRVVLLLAALVLETDQRRWPHRRVLWSWMLLSRRDQLVSEWRGPAPNSVALPLRYPSPS